MKLDRHSFKSMSEHRPAMATGIANGSRNNSIIGKGSVAIVDDSPAILNIIMCLIGSNGYNITGYSSPHLLINQTELKHTCLIVDQIMPRMTGLELVSQLRQAQNQIPILLMTGLVTPAIAQRAAQLNIAKIVEKPMDIDEVLTFVAQHC